MKKILFITFYEIKDYLACIKENFEKSLFTVLNYPLFRYAYDANDKLEDYKEHLNEHIQDVQPDIVLWWFIDVPADVFRYIKTNNPDIFYIMYNSDDPLNLNKELFDRAKIFDTVVTPCKESVYMYKLYSNVENIVFGPMGYDETMFKPLDNDDNLLKKYDHYRSDISMLFYNLYLDKSYYPDQVVYKKELVDNIINLCNSKKYTLKIYGAPVLNEFFPDHYCGEVPYFELNMVYNLSKINIVSSPSKTKSLNINEYVFPILGSGGLLMIDRIKDIEKILTDGQNCVIYDSDDYLSKIDHILSNYSSYTVVKDKGHIVSKNYTWEKWVNNLVKEIGKHFFNPELYSNMYDLSSLNMDSGELLERWLSTGNMNREVCYDFNVPESFNAEDYINDKGIKNNDRYAYLHWRLNSNNTIYMRKKKKKDNNSGTNISFDTVMEDYYNVCAILNKVIKYNTRDEGLAELNRYCQQTPGLPINDIVNSYVDNVL